MLARKRSTISVDDVTTTYVGGDPAGAHDEASY
jgi:hypothetical protein